MSNKENLWRLQDEEGKPVAKKPSHDVKFMMKKADGTWKEIMGMQSIKAANITRSVEPIREVGSVNPVHSVTVPVDLTINADVMTGPLTLNNNVYWSDTVADATRDYARINAERLDQRIREEVYRYAGSPFVGAVNPQRESIEQTIPDILTKIMMEVDRYQARYHDRPMWISLDREHYRSYWLEARSRARQMHTTDVNEMHFMGLMIICNVTQQEPVMALGSAMQEGIEGRLYRE
jgi:hypothetical protein